MKYILIGIEDNDELDRDEFRRRLRECTFNFINNLESVGLHIGHTNDVFVYGPPVPNPPKDESNNIPPAHSESIPAIKTEMGTPIIARPQVLERLHKIGVYTYQDIGKKMTLADVYSIEGLSFPVLLKMWDEMKKVGVDSFKCGKTDSHFSAQEMRNTFDRPTDPSKFKFKCIPPKKMLDMLLAYLMAFKHQKSKHWQKGCLIRWKRNTGNE